MREYVSQDLAGRERKGAEERLRMRIRARWWTMWTVALLALAVLTAGGGAAQKKKKDAKKETPPEAPKDVAMPFKVGEKLAYRVAWATFSSAATVETSAIEQRDLFGWRTWHFRVLIHTAGSVRSLFTIDDQADSYADTVTQETRQFEMYLDEMGRKQNVAMQFVPPGQSARGGVPMVVLQQGTRDPLATIYTLRAVDWKQTPEVKVPLYDGRNIYQMQAKLDSASEKVTTAAGNFDATRVSIHLFQYGKQVADNDFVIWFAHDDARTPVAMQANLPFGSLHVEMTPAGK